MLFLEVVNGMILLVRARALNEGAHIKEPM